MKDITKIISCGMITSNVGLVEVPHVTVPASTEGLAAGAKEILLEDGCSMLITFIPGVKNNSDP
nr:2-dehydro-3-deoxygalactonokinase [Clostridium sp. AM58-1XD]